MKSMPMNIFGLSILLILLIILMVSYAILIWLNRGSERVLGAAIPILLGAISSIGAGLALTVLSLGEPALTSSFETLFTYSKKDKVPFRPATSIPGYAWLPDYISFSAQMIEQAQPAVVHDPDDPLGQDLYHHLLQRAIIDWISEHYGDSWDVDIVRFERHLGGGGWYGQKPGSQERKKIYTAQQVQQLLKGNKSVGIQPVRQLALPPDTILTVDTPPPHGPGDIILKNAFCTITIHTRPVQAGSGVLEHYIRFYGLSRTEAAEYENALYHVTTTVEFSKYRAGNPKTRKYKAWAEQLTRGLQAEFDEQGIWSKAKDEYLFWK